MRTCFVLFSAKSLNSTVSIRSREDSVRDEEKSAQAQARSEWNVEGTGMENDRDEADGIRWNGGGWNLDGKNKNSFRHTVSLFSSIDYIRGISPSFELISFRFRVRWVVSGLRVSVATSASGAEYWSDGLNRQVVC